MVFLAVVLDENLIEFNVKDYLAVSKEYEFE